MYPEEAYESQERKRKEEIWKSKSIVKKEGFKKSEKKTNKVRNLYILLEPSRSYNLKNMAITK